MTIAVNLLRTLYETASDIPNGLYLLEEAKYVLLPYCCVIAIVICHRLNNNYSLKLNHLPLLHGVVVFKLLSLDVVDQAYDAFIQYAPNINMVCPLYLFWLVRYNANRFGVFLFSFVYLFVCVGFTLTYLFY